MKLYGRLGFYHHSWSRVLTLLSAEGVEATLAAVKSPGGVRLKRGGDLPRYVEVREGALDELIETHGVEVLDAEDWGRTKAELGQRCTGGPG